MRIAKCVNGEIIYRDMTPAEEEEYARRQEEQHEEWEKNRPRAEKPLAKGEYFYIDSQLCKAKTSISKGAIITLNTNYQVTNVEEELTKLNV